MLPKHILVPTDFSEAGEEALDFACELARPFGATVHLLHVIAIPTLGVPELGVALTSTVIDSMVKDNQDLLEALIARKKSCAPFGEPLLRTGDARHLINESAKELNADLIVMGTHGRRGFS